MYLLEVFLELIELSAQLFPFSFNVGESFLGFCIVVNGILSFHFFELGALLVAERSEVFSC